MNTLTIIAIALILYGLACLYVGLARPQAFWKLGKFQGFVQLLGEKGTIVMLMIIAAATLIGGIAILLS